MSFGKTDLSSLLRTDAECLRLIHSTHFPNDVWTRDAAVHADRAAALLESRGQHIKELTEAAQAVVDYSDSQGDLHEIPADALDRLALWLNRDVLDALQAGAEADPDVADTAWAIIDHHRQHRTAG